MLSNTAPRHRDVDWICSCIYQTALRHATRSASKPGPHKAGGMHRKSGCIGCHWKVQKAAECRLLITSEHASAFSCGYVPHTCSVITRNCDCSGAAGGEVCSIDASAVHACSIPVPPALQHAAALHVQHVPHRHSAVKQDDDC